MVPSVTTVLQRFKTDWAAQLHPDAIHAACQEVGYTSWRDRLLNPVTTVQLFLLQILHGNTACQHLPHLSGLRFSASAYCQARSKLPLPVLAHLLERLGHSAQPALSEEGRWHGHRTFFVDGSGCSMPDTPGFAGGVRPARGTTARLWLSRCASAGPVSCGTGLLTQLVVAPLNTHDLARMREVHPALQSGDVLVADRGLCSYAHLALLAQAGLHALLRVQARQIVDFTPARPFVMPGTRRTPEIKGLPRSRWIKAHGKHDQQVEWFKPKTCPPWLEPGDLQDIATGMSRARNPVPSQRAGVSHAADHCRDHVRRRK